MSHTYWLGSIVAVAFAVFASGSFADDPKPKLNPAKAAAEAQKKLLERFDTNKDGVLSDAEQLRAQEELKKQGALVGSGLVPGGFPGADEFLKKFDKNRDGKLTGEEKIAAQAAMQKLRRGGGPATGGFGGPVGGVPAAGTAPPAGDDKPDRKPNPLIKLYDLDGDGKLNDEEKAALQADRGKKNPKEKAKTKKDE
jgi:Ca2+-binding EF-hand superfamily protein